MVRYCQECGRQAPNDAVLCPYCGVNIDYSRSHIIPDHKPVEKDNKVIIIIAIVVILLVIVPIAIAATVYVYVSGMLGPIDVERIPHVYISEFNNQIKITLIKEGENYNNGYSDFYITINNKNVDGLSNVGYWTVGEEIIIGADNTGYKVDGSPLSYGNYDVKVYIQSKLIYNNDINI